MYTAFYGLREKPFALSPDPRFLYLAASHREALAHLLYGIEQGEGFISVTGEVGTGKTTLCRTLLERLEGQIELAFLFNPSRSALELLQSICAEFGLPAEGLGRRNLMSQLNKFLLEQKERGRRVLLIVDEAQTLSENTLEQVRLLSNLETSRAKLIQILLLGQPELDRKLDERGLRQLRQRISVRWKLEPLSATETVAYVRHRIAIAAGQPKDLFPESALRAVHRRTGGIPRLVNQLCDRALLAGYAVRAAQIGPALIRAAAREIPDVRDPEERDPRGGRSLLPPWMKRPWMSLALTLGFVAAALATGLAVGRSGFGAGRSDASDTGADGRVPPSVSARAADVHGAGAAGAQSGDAANAGSAAERPGVLGRLIGYVPGVLPGAASDELRASDERLAAAGIGPSALSGPSAALPGLSGLPVASGVSRSAVAPGLLPTLLVNRTPAEALAESERAFLDLYDLPSDPIGSPPADAEALARRLEQRGLMTTAFDGGSLDMLRRLDHPVLIPIAVDPTPSGVDAAPAAAAGATATSSAQGSSAPTSPASTSSVPATAPPSGESTRRWLALTGFDGGRVWLAGLVPGRVVSVDQAELAPRWLEAGVIVWRNHESLAARVERDGPVDSVRWLQRSLAELRYFAGDDDGVFDARTADALRDFQNAHGLVEDGVVGPLTQIALYAQLARYPVPRLSASAVRPPPGPPRAGPPPSSAAAAPSDDATLTPPPGDRG